MLSVQEGRVERALAPVENALEGGVDPVLDCLALEADDVAMIGEVVQPVSYCLAAGSELALEDITMVLSHPQALGQCRRWLAEHLPNAAVGAGRVDRGRGARRRRGPVRHAGGDRPAAGRPPLRRGDARRGPRGRSRQRDPVRLAGAGPRTRRRRPSPAPAKTALIFWGAGSGSPGWLVSCLAVFAFAGVNLTRIESRPLRRGMGEYMFFLDLEGSMADTAVSGAVRDLHKHAEVVRVLGSFATAKTGP